MFTHGREADRPIVDVGGVVVTSLFIGMVSAETGNLTLVAEEETPADNPWYSPNIRSF